MSDSFDMIEKFRKLLGVYTKALHGLVLLLAIVAGTGILTMMSITCLDIVLRLFRIPLAGAYDIVKIAGTLTIACAMPYTTAVKGHVAIEYFFHKLSRRSRIFVDTLIRLLGIALFACLTWQMVIYGLSLKRSGQVTLTLQVPIFWVPYVMAFSCGVMVMVIGYNLLHPGKEMIKP